MNVIFSVTSVIGIDAVDLLGFGVQLIPFIVSNLTPSE
jgi:hypothetical protein